MKKVYDLVVSTGGYTNKNGEQKTNWLNVGAVMENEGKQFVLLDRTFNPAGVPNPENRGNVLISMFVPKAQQGYTAPQREHTDPQQSGEPAGFDDDIPF